MEEEQYVHLANHICLEPWSLTCLPCFPVVWISEEILSSLGVLWIESMAPSPQPYPKNLQPGAKEGCFLLWLLGSIVPVVSVAPPPARSSEEWVFSIGWTSPGKCSSHPNWNFHRTSQKALGNRNSSQGRPYGIIWDHSNSKACSPPLTAGSSWLPSKSWDGR